MNGGLRVDDHKNNVKYIICKDGSIKNISNLKNADVNIYDRRDAAIISDRVKRFLGGDHKYSDYHMFWKGHMLDEGKLMTFSEFIKTYES